VPGPEDLLVLSQWGLLVLSLGELLVLLRRALKLVPLAKLSWLVKKVPWVERMARLPPRPDLASLLLVPMLWLG
jgi:hypothetical protein